MDDRAITTLKNAMKYLEIERKELSRFSIISTHHPLDEAGEILRTALDMTATDTGKTLEKFIQLFCARSPESFAVPGERFAHLPPGLIYRGSAGWSDGDTVPRRELPPGFLEVESWSDGFRTVWVNEELRAIITYCEGDINVTIDPHQQTFSARLISAHEFYAEYV